MTNDQSTGVVGMVNVWHKFNYDWYGKETVTKADLIKRHDGVHREASASTARLKKKAAQLASGFTPDLLLLRHNQHYMQRLVVLFPNSFLPCQQSWN